MSAADHDAPQSDVTDADIAATDAQAAPDLGGEGDGETDDAVTTPDPADVIVALNEENNRLKDQLLRAMAEAENVRRRTDKEKADARAYALDKFASDLLAVADNFDRAVQTAPDALKGDAGFDGFLTGVEMTGRELQTVLARHGIKRVGERGEKFDPAIHQAVSQMPSDEIAKDDVAEVFQAGYVLNGRLLRAAMVVVSAGPAA
jgi:molecular chaperone GrpE